MCFNIPFGVELKGGGIYEFMYFCVLTPLLSLIITIIYLKLILHIKNSQKKFSLNFKKTSVRSLKFNTIILTFLNTSVWLPLGLFSL